jgi:hypothetical protein
VNWKGFREQQPTQVQLAIEVSCDVVVVLAGGAQANQRVHLGTRRCHHCGNTDIPFGDEYCNERCQDYSIEFCYPCFRGADCKACDNYDKDHYEREENLVYDDSGEMTPRGRVIKIDKKDVNWTDDEEEYDDDHYEEFSRSDRNNEDGLEECQECGEQFENFMNSDVCEKCYETLINIE